MTMHAIAYTATTYRYVTPPAVAHYAIIAVRVLADAAVEFVVFDGDKATAIRSHGGSWVYPNGTALAAGALTAQLELLRGQLERQCQG
jgi:hypothetical protein